jgi:deoxyhypusine synthase
MNQHEQKEKKLYPHPQKLNDLPDHPNIEGYDFSKSFDFTSFLQSYASTGFQASNLAKGIETIKAMKRENATIYLTFTSNMISSGLRDIVTYLVKEKFVDVLVTTAGGVEEDVMKIKAPFKLGTFNASPRSLYDNGVFRTGNLFIPNTRYAYLELFIDPFLKQLYEEGKKTLCTHEFIKEMGLKLEGQENAESSYIYWAAKHNIPVFCPGLIDGSIGDMISFFKYNHKDFYLDTTGDIVGIDKISNNAEKTGIICLGGGLAKHFALNSQIIREGADFAVYVNTAQEFDGCDSGANISEAQTWSKVRLDALSVKIHADATIVFPLLIAGVLTSSNSKK